MLIYKANQDKISDPDQLVEGSTLVIPPLEGTPNNLTRNDSLEISEGYRLLYDYYNANQNPAAENFRRAVNVYKPK